MPETFHDLIARNRRNSALLVAAFLFLFAGAAFVFAAYLSGGLRSAVLPAAAALAAGGIAGIFAWYKGADAVLSLSGAREIAREDDPQLWNVVEEMSVAAGIPVPKIYLIDDTAMNAFATGRDPQHAAVAVTRGLRERLSRDELQGVIAHEISHVRNLDIRFSMLLAVLVGLLALLADGFRRWMWWGGGRRRSRRGRGGSSGGGALIAVLALLLAILAPLLGKLIQFAASRQREYLADASGVELTRYPEALASALEKLSGDREVLESANRATQHLYVVNPLRPFEDRAKGLFTTHPPISERVARLRALGGGRNRPS